MREALTIFGVSFWRGVKRFENSREIETRVTVWIKNREVTRHGFISSNYWEVTRHGFISSNYREVKLLRSWIKKSSEKPKLKREIETDIYVVIKRK